MTRECVVEYVTVFCEKIISLTKELELEVSLHLLVWCGVWVGGVGPARTKTCIGTY